MSLALSKSATKLDRIGIVMSGICAIHCLVVPLILPALAVMKLGFIATEGFEYWSWRVTFGLCAAVTVYQFASQHRHGAVFIPLALAFALWLNKGAFGESAEPWAAMGVGILLVATHFLNLKMCASCPKCQAKA